MPPEKHSNTGTGYPLSKKPKLDLSETSNLSVTNCNQDDLWGEDLPEEDLNAIFLLASQAAPQIEPQNVCQKQQEKPPSNNNVFVPKIAKMTGYSQHGNHSSASVSNLPSKVTKDFRPSQQTMPSTLFQVPESNFPNNVQLSKSYHRQWNGNNKIQMTSDVVVAKSSSYYAGRKTEVRQSQTNVSTNTSLISAPSALHQQDLRSNSLIDKLQSENKLLLEKSQTKDGEIFILRQQLKKCDLQASTQQQSKEKEYQTKIQALEKEVEKAKTANQLEKLETLKANYKNAALNNTQSVTEVQKPDPQLCDKLDSIGCNYTSVSEGQLFLISVSPYIFKKFLSGEHDQTVLQLSIESCIEPVTQLGLESSLNSITAQCLTEKVFTICRKVMCHLLTELRKLGKKKINTDSNETANLDRNCLDNSNLLCQETWFENERGVESRRVLGLVGELCLLSEYMTMLVFGKGLQHASQKLFPIVKKIVNNVSLASIATNTQEPRNFENKPPGQHGNGVDQHEEELNQLIQSYENEDFGFLSLLNDISLVIMEQNVSTEYSGVLAAIVSLLANTKRKGSCMVDKSINIISKIVNTVIFSRPQMETTVAVTELLQDYSWNKQFLNMLCNCSSTKSNVETNSKIYQFDQNSSALQELCWQIERRSNSVCLRARMCRAMVNLMMLSIKTRPLNCPKWSSCEKPSPTDQCLCKSRVVEVTITLIYKTFIDFDKFASVPSHQSDVLRYNLVKGVLLLYYQLDSDPDFGYLMEEVEGYYQLLLIALKNTEHDLSLQNHEHRGLKYLLEMEENVIPKRSSLSAKLLKYFDGICERIKVPLSQH